MYQNPRSTGPMVDVSGQYRLVLAHHDVFSRQMRQQLNMNRKRKTSVERVDGSPNHGVIYKKTQFMVVICTIALYDTFKLLCINVVT